MTFYDYVLSYIKSYDYTANTEKTIIRYCFMIKELCDDLSIDFKSEIDRDIDKLVNNKEFLLDLELKLHLNFQQIFKRHFFLFL